MEQDQGGYLRHDECDGLIITVGHKDQVSSSCITLTLLTPLPGCKCAQSDILQVENKPTHLTTRPALLIPDQLVFQSKPQSVIGEGRSAEPQAYLRPYSRYLDQNAGVWTATGPRTVKPRRRTI